MKDKKEVKMQIDEKINKLIEESIQKYVKKILHDISILPNKYLTIIKQKYNIKIKEEIQESISTAKVIEGEISPLDTCYTAVMKLIGLSSKIKKYPIMANFIHAYIQKYSKLLELDFKNIDDLKPGTIIFLEAKTQSSYSVNRTYDSFGIGQKKETSVGHLMIFIGKKDNNYLFLNNTLIGDDRKNHVIGSGLELKINRWTSKNLKKISGYKIKILDYKKMASL